MKLTKNAAGKNVLSIRLQEWMKIGRAQGWLSKIADNREHPVYPKRVTQDFKKMALKWEDLETGEQVSCPAKVAVCPVCEGRGSHVNPAIDAQGLSAEDFAEDPDFERDYHSGAYDVKCRSCNGNRVILVPADMNSECAKSLQAMLEEEAQYQASVRAERSFGASSGASPKTAAKERRTETDGLYDPNMEKGVAGDAGKPKCSGCGTPADRIVDKSAQEWACQKCKLVNRLKGTESLTFPDRLDESKDKSPAEKKGAAAAPARTAADEQKVLPLIKMTRTRVEEYLVCPHCQQEIGEKESFFSEVSRKAEANGRVVFQHRRCGGHYDMGPVVPLGSFLKRF